MAGRRYDAKVIEMKMLETAPGEVGCQYQQSRGTRAYINCDGLTVASDFEKDVRDARDALAVKLIMMDVVVPGLTD
jgi:hypothetical protein